ncbi:LPS biosynthesis protein [Mycoplasmopsis californica]|uniref:LicD family protein n=1 Tax=Mycoplasmopsis equigenitalium TaxID=114883 RepID=A0ABY5J4C5_9BACT|nr:LicD family protein [Mycoplasmopsis equigenitalium]UUD36805.1 LicD family protein [Mycoplasmopsis equigenitalium]VEU69897.1 LPS biosynthesis protein [Mycoplasmopsis californica]
MTDKQIRTLDLLKEFVEIADKHQLEYLIFYGSLLGTIRHNGFIPWDDDIDLVITKETYDFLVEHYPDKIKTNENSNNFLLIPKFSNDDDTNINAVFLDLFVIVKTSKPNIKKYTSPKRVLRWMATFINRKTHKYQWGINILKVLFFWTRWWKKYTFKKAYNDLYDKNGDVFCIIFSPMKKDTLCNIFDNIDFKNYKTHKFEDTVVRVPNNWEEIFLKNYGPNWRTPIKYKYCEHFGMYDMYVCTYRPKNKK